MWPCGDVYGDIDEQKKMDQRQKKKEREEQTIKLLENIVELLGGQIERDYPERDNPYIFGITKGTEIKWKEIKRKGFKQ